MNVSFALRFSSNISSFIGYHHYLEHGSDLYPTLLRVPMVSRTEEYFVPFPNNLDRKSFQRVAKDGMLIRNHDFNESAELVSFGF